MNHSYSDVSIIIPNWNGRELLKKHLPIVLSHVKGAQVIVVDDASGDDSVVFLREHFPGVTVIEKKKHEGFASTANAGVRIARGRIVVFLNTDIEPERGFLDALIPHFEDPNIFAVGCMDKSQEKNGTVLRGRGIAWWEKGFFVHKRGEVDRTDTAWVSGGSGAFRTSTFMLLGGFDPLYNPFYWEDIDLSYRARKAGYTVLFEPKSVVIHKHEEGAILKNYTPGQVKRIAYRNQFLFIRKNISDPFFLLSHHFWTKIRLMRAFLSLDIPFIAGYMVSICMLPQILIRRIQIMKFWKISDRKLLGNPSHE